MTLASDDAARLLVDVLVKATVILALAGVAALALRRSSAAARHMVWFLAMGGLLLLPVLAVTLPALSVPVPNWFAAETVQPPAASDSVAVSGLASEEPGRASSPANMATQRQSVTLPPTSSKAKTSAAPRQPAAPSSVESSGGAGSLFGAAAPAVSDTESPSGAGSLFDAAPPAASATASPGGAGGLLDTVASAPLAPEISVPATVPWALWVLIVWAAGMLAILAMRVVGSVCVWRRAAESAPVTSGAWRDLAEELAASLGLARRVRLLESDRPLMPVTWGMVQPAVLLPPAGEWSDDRRRVVLLHELAHVKRWDCLTQAVAQVACAVYWFHPLAWYAARRLRLEREAACDDLVLGAGLQAPDYAAHLLDLARSLRGPACPSMAAVAMARRSHIESRLRGILDTARSRRPISWRGLTLAVVAAACLLVPVAACRPTTSAETVKTEAAKTEDAPADSAKTAVAKAEPAKTEKETPAVQGKGRLIDGGVILPPPPPEIAPLTPEEQLVVNLESVIMATVNPISDSKVAAWNSEGGPASLQFFQGLAIVSQTPEGQRKIIELLQTLHRAGAIKVEVPKESEALFDPSPEDTEVVKRKARIRELLAGKIDVDFAQNRSDNVLKFIDEKVPGLNIVISPDVAAGGIDLSAWKVDLKAKQKPVGWILDQILPSDPACGYRVENGYLLITTRARLEQNMPVAVYRVWSKDGHPLAFVKDAPSLWGQVENIIKIYINSFNIPRVAEWFDSGGPAQIRFFNDTIIVSQTPAGHEQVASLLKRLAQLGVLGAGSGEAFALADKPEPGLAVVRRTLQEPVNLDFERKSLLGVLKFLGELKPGLAIQIDPGVAADGIDLSSRLVDLKVMQVSVKAVLDLILEVDLAYDLTAEGIRITTLKRQQQNLPTVVYKVKKP
jgi:beta-lactamase regulating signal transducer with metallopeptidase domain